MRAARPLGPGPLLQRLHKKLFDISVPCIHPKHGPMHCKRTCSTDNVFHVDFNAAKQNTSHGMIEEALQLVHTLRIYHFTV